MPPRKKQRHAHHAAAAAPGDGVQPGPSSAPAAAAFPLLSLPHAVLAQHVWPLLSPWGRAQLRATCKELRGLADGLFEGTLQLEVTPELEPYARAVGRGKAAYRRWAAKGQHTATTPSQTETSRAEKEWSGKCNLLARCPRMQSLELQMGMEGKLSYAARRQLCTAAGSRIRHLKLCPSAENRRYTGVGHLYRTVPTVSSMFPALQALHLEYSPSRGVTPAKAAAAFRSLPATLESLSLVLEEEIAAQQWPTIAAGLGSTTQLSRLHSLEIQFEGPAQQMDVAPLAPIASSLTNLHVWWDDGYGVSGLSQLLAACSTSLTRLNLSAYVKAAPDQPHLSQILAAAPNLQHLEVSVDDHEFDDEVGLIREPTAADVHALRTHPNLRQLVIKSDRLHTQLAAAALPPGSLQHLHIDVHCFGWFSPEELLQLLSIGPLSAGCRLVSMTMDEPSIVLGQTPLDVGVVGRLARMLRESGVKMVTREEATRDGSQTVWDGSQAAGATGSDLPAGMFSVDVNGPLDQASDQEAVAGVLASLPGLHLKGQLLDVFCQEATAVGAPLAGSSAGVWLLPALAHITTLSLGNDTGPDDKEPDFLAALQSALSNGYLPRLRHLICRDPPYKGDLVAWSEVLNARPGLEISVAWVSRVDGINELRAKVAEIPARRPATAGKPKGRGRGTSSAAAQSHGRQPAVALDDEGRRLLLQQMLF